MIAMARPGEAVADRLLALRRVHSPGAQIVCADWDPWCGMTPILR